MVTVTRYKILVYLVYCTGCADLELYALYYYNVAKLSVGIVPNKPAATHLKKQNATKQGPLQRPSPGQLPPAALVLLLTNGKDKNTNEGTEQRVDF